jgi:hypothetical protein
MSMQGKERQYMGECHKTLKLLLAGFVILVDSINIKEVCTRKPRKESSNAHLYYRFIPRIKANLA